MSMTVKADPGGTFGVLQINGVDKFIIGPDDNLSDANGIRLNSGKKNYIVDGDFNFWYEGVSQTISGYGSDTMWINARSGSTQVHTREEFPLGQVDVLGNPEFFSRTVITSVGGASNLAYKLHRVEDVSPLSGKTVTLSFYAKADSPKNITVEFSQYFGTGGSPSGTVNGIGSQKVALTTSWEKYTVTVAIPSLSGETLGTDGNDSLDIFLWMDAGSNFDARTDSLGQQSGTFDIARVRLVEGTVDGDDIDETYAEVLQKVNRYFWQGNIGTGAGYKYNGSTLNSLHAQTFSFPVLMRVDPVMGIPSSGSFTNCTFSSLSGNKAAFEVRVDVVGAVHYRAWNGTYSADARL